MSASALSIMDEKPSLEPIYRKLSILATAALAVHVLWTHESPGDSLASWLASTMPTLLTGIILFGLLIFAANEYEQTVFFSLTETSTRTRGVQKRLRKSSNPAREDCHIFNVLVIALAGGLGVSVDLVHFWYMLSGGAWDEFTGPPDVLIIMVTLVTGMLGFFLFLTWLPMWGLLQTQREFGGQVYAEESEDSDPGSQAMLRTLVGAMETYQKDLWSQRKPSQFKNEVIGDFLEVLRKWQTVDH